MPLSPPGEVVQNDRHGSSRRRILVFMATHTRSGSIVIERPADEVFDMVADVTRMGEWSPVCKACWWNDGDGPATGATFTGRNEVPERTWETRSEVVASERGRAFAWVVVEPPTRAAWSYTFEPIDGGTRLTETWELPEEGVAFFEQHLGDEAAAQIAARGEAAENGIAVTLAAIREAAERG